MTYKNCQNCYYEPLDLWEDEPCKSCSGNGSRPNNKWRKQEPRTCKDCFYADQYVGECEYTIHIDIKWPDASLINPQTLNHKKPINDYTEHECPCWKLKQ